MVYNTINHTTDDSLGGQVEQTGNMLEQQAIQRQQLANETNLDDVYTNQFSPAGCDVYQEYMKLEGKDVEARFPEFQQHISNLRMQTSSAAFSTVSPFYKFDLTTPVPPEQQKWNVFVSRFAQALDDWQQNNSGKIPTDMQKREIAKGILFPNGLPGQQQASVEAGPTSLDHREVRDYDGTQAAEQKEKPDSWCWQALESSDTLKPYAPKVREYVESLTDTKGAWDWLISTVPKSAAQLGVGLAKTPFDLAQTFGSGSQAAIENFLREHPEYGQLAREDPTGQSLETLGAIGAWAGLQDTAEATVKGATAFIGKRLGIDTEKQAWSWENFKDAWVNHPVESFAAVFPFGAAFLKRKGITPSEIQVRELVDSAVKNEKTPLAQELKKEMLEGPPKGELDFPEVSMDAPKSGATLAPLEAEARVAALATRARKIHSTLLSQLPVAFRVIFATSCAERLMPAYRLFHTEIGGGDPVAMSRALEDLWANPVLPEVHEEVYEQQLEKIMGLIPQDDEIGASWSEQAIYAQDSGTSLAYALRARLTGEPQEAAWAARVAYAALDNFVIIREDIDTNKPGGEQRLISHPIVQAELRRQQRDLDELLNSSGQDVQEIALRFRDRARAEAGSFFGPVV
jgi:uncharacterized protein YjaG (DUF416 family)